MADGLDIWVNAKGTEIITRQFDADFDFQPNIWYAPAEISGLKCPWTQRQIVPSGLYTSPKYKLGNYDKVNNTMTEMNRIFNAKSLGISRSEFDARGLH